MTEYGFYHLTRAPVERALPLLLHKMLATGKPALVRLGRPERLEHIDRTLWSAGRDSWLPHGTDKERFAAEQPILLTGGLANPNGSVFLVILDQADAADAAQFERVFELFDGDDSSAVHAARTRWVWAGEQGFERVYWQQNERGSWRRANQAKA